MGIEAFSSDSSNDDSTTEDESDTTVNETNTSRSNNGSNSSDLFTDSKPHVKPAFSDSKVIPIDFEVIEDPSEVHEISKATDFDTYKDDGVIFRVVYSNMGEMFYPVKNNTEGYSANVRNMLRNLVPKIKDFNTTLGIDQDIDLIDEWNSDDNKWSTPPSNWQTSSTESDVDWAGLLDEEEDGNDEKESDNTETEESKETNSDDYEWMDSW